MPDGAHRHPLIPPREVDPRQNLPALEQTVLARWRERDVFAKSLSRARGRHAGSSTRGRRPPTARPAPITCSRACSRTSTRAIRRCAATGRTQGRLGLPWAAGRDRGRTAARLHDQGRHRALRDRGVQRDVPRVGVRLRRGVGPADRADRLLDRPRRRLPHARRVYIESVWWALAQICKQGLLYEGHKVVPYCSRCGTALSSHEVALGYKDVVDRSVYVRLPLLAGTPLRRASLLVWTTTPWTLPGTSRSRSRPTSTYVRARGSERGRDLAAALVERVLGERAEVLERFPGSSLVGRALRGPIFPLGRTPTRAGRPLGACPSPVIAGDFVTTEDGTGLVHIAPAFGEDDFRVAAATGVGGFDPRQPRTLFNPVKPDGTYDASVRSDAGGSHVGRVVKDPELTETLIEDLRARGLLFREQPYEHSYPHCWRCGTPLIYYARSAWYIAQPGCASRCSPRTRRSAGTRSTSSMGASEAGSRATSTGRCRASAIGARRCRSGAARRATPRRSGRSPSSSGAPGASWPTIIARSSTTSNSRAHTFQTPRRASVASPCGASRR